ncbi:hypothetical protein ZIOFF_021963 [Zingiber officinale]|uniref:BHLH domain-containing protein n=2 Tax=Zingiber officinale TaxID=94328 RepID=A0A8J5H256_ZINOF|nr:hypothetical protein ZIOFF_021963 [Zingiber officinale]
MDNFISPFLSQPSWPDNSVLPWDGVVVSQINSLLADSFDAYQEEKKNPSPLMVSSSHVNGIPVAEDYLFEVYGEDMKNNCSWMVTSSHVDEIATDEDFNKHAQDGTCVLNSHVNEVVVPDCNTTIESVLSPCSLPISSSIERDFTKLPSFPPFSNPTTWYSNVSSFIEHGHFHGIGFQGAECDSNVLNKTCFENGHFTHLDSVATASLNPTDNLEFQDPDFPYFSSEKQINLAAETLQLTKDENEMQDIYPSSFPREEIVSSRQTGIQTYKQISGSQSQQINNNTYGSNGAMKPRVRARRGQATDPHSIAERLRRERIADRMKNLQELVPNSKKTDKASMLDEIIDYVKFLQLQVKILSMSRLGAAGAVVPLLTDGQVEGFGTLLSSPEEAFNLSDTEDNLTFEQEVVKLMETNVTAAMQYLQDKGLCLMPIALATAISNHKGSSSAAIPPERMKDGVTYEAISRSSQGPSSCNGALVKQEAPAQIPNEAKIAI